MIKKIVSGGQTGADQAALDAAINMDIPHGGWVPKGRKTENGSLSDSYCLKEMPNGVYSSRTEQNVIDSDGTVIMSHGPLTGGSDYTREMALKHDRPWLYINLDVISESEAVQAVTDWAVDNNIEVLNVAGSRFSKDPGIYEAVFSVMKGVLTFFKT